ncbi:nucleoside hydrolase [Aquimarina hainanensis]|uniref:Nucleoside hydrolase n=1 Tax=Aquimarina hainanensis TaxID=1578017 RepID=A0ABW5N836_9FLAO
MKRKFIIDTDTASDDAVALIMAMNYPDVEVEAFTLVAGNVSLEQGVQNAMFTIELCKKEIPVYAGIGKPMLRSLETAEHVHGKDGMGDIGLLLSGYIPEKEHAVSILVQKINEHPGEISLICLAPLTNIATALLIDPSIASKVKECVIMGGIGEGRGNVTPIAEYNFWADPEAAKIVFESGMPIKMVGWDISRTYAVFDKTDAEKIKDIGTSLANFTVDIQKKCDEYARNNSRIKGFDLPDPIAMAVALDSDVATVVKDAYVRILTNDDYSRGQSAMDYTGATGMPPNAQVVLEADRERFLEILYQALGK